MPTAMRSCFYPGEDRTALCSIDEAAGRLMARLERGEIGNGERVVL